MRRIAVLWLLFLGLLPATARAESIGPELEMAIHLKILSFDAALKDRPGTTVGIAILHPADQKSTASAYVDAVSALGDKTTVQGKKVRAWALPISADLSDRLAGASALYVIDGVSTDTVAAIGRIAAARKLPLLSGDRAYLAYGAAVAVVEKSNKPSIVVNATNAKACGMMLDSKLLRLAEVVK